MSTALSQNSTEFQRDSLQPTSLGVSLLTGGQDRPYALGLAMSLIEQGLDLDVIGSDEVDSPEMRTTPRLRFFNLRGNQRRGAGLLEKVRRVLFYYARLMRYAAVARPKVLHILWNNRFEYFDRTLLMLYYRLCGKRIALTAHNVNIAKRDGNDSFLNRLTLKIQYQLCSQLFVHTDKMKAELMNDFGVSAANITVLVHPINDAFPNTALTPSEARQKLGINHGERTMLFFGRLQPYKGLEYLIEALDLLAKGREEYKLIIAGEPKKGSEAYEAEIQRLLAQHVQHGRVLPVLKFIPDEEAELYFKAADVLVLPYKDIFQSGVLFLGLTYGLPVIASDVGSFSDDVIKGKTGLICRPGDSADLARAVQEYFSSDLYLNLTTRRHEIRETTMAQHSWAAVGELTRTAYEKVLKG